MEATTINKMPIARIKEEIIASGLWQKAKNFFIVLFSSIIMYNLLVLFHKVYKFFVLLSIIMSVKDKNSKLANNIKLYRKSLNLTQEQLANKLNGKKSLVSNYENGYSTPDIETLIKLADIFDVSLDELVGRRS